MTAEGQRFQELVGQLVVVDTDSDHLYAGELVSVDDAALELSEADVHDLTTSSTTRDVYIINLVKFGIKKNRERVLVRMARVVSLSRISDITAY